AVARLLPQDPALPHGGRPGVLARDDDRGAAHGRPPHRGAGELLPPPRRRIEALGEPLAQHAYGLQDAEPDRTQAAEPALRLASALQTRSGEGYGREGDSRSFTRERSTARPGASGRQRAGSVGPKSTTPRAPTAPARWLTPLSLPRYASVRARSAATSGRDQPETTAPSSGASPASAGPS